jgi:hypothetical protein
MSSWMMTLAGKKTILLALSLGALGTLLSFRLLQLRRKRLTSMVTVESISSNGSKLTNEKAELSAAEVQDAKFFVEWTTKCIDSASLLLDSWILPRFLSFFLIFFDSHFFSLCYSWTLHEGKQSRYFKTHVSFQKTFSSAPQVFISIKGFRATTEEDLRLSIQALNVTPQGALSSVCCLSLLLLQKMKTNKKKKKLTLSPK